MKAEEFLIRQGCQRMDCGEEKCNFFEDVEPKDLNEYAIHILEELYPKFLELTYPISRLGKPGAARMCSDKIKELKKQLINETST